jgi:hypothetical protein
MYMHVKLCSVLISRLLQRADHDKSKQIISVMNISASQSSLPLRKYASMSARCLTLNTNCHLHLGSGSWIAAAWLIALHMLNVLALTAGLFFMTT